VKSMLSINYLNQAGAVIETGFERFNIRANLHGDINKNISLGWNIAGAFFREQYAATNGRDAIIGSALWADPREPVYNDDGTFNDYLCGQDRVFGTVNPVQEMKEMERNRNNSDLISHACLEIRYLKDFTFSTSVYARPINQKMKDSPPPTLAGRGFDQPP